MHMGGAERLTEQGEMTSRQIHHGNLSKVMHPQFCPLPFYSAFQLMSLLLSLSLTAVDQSGFTEEKKTFFNGVKVVWFKF